MIKRILIPTDGSGNSGKAVKLALELAKSGGARLIALHVIDSTAYLSLPETFMWENVKGMLDEEAKKALEQVKSEAKKEGVKVKILTREGSPAKEIIEAAEEEKADLIVMGTAGRTGLDRFFLGSVSEKVLRAAFTPVLVVK